MTSIGRNKPCPCGSGKKSKKCCGTGAIGVVNSAGLAEHYNEQANALADQGRLYDAIRCYETALEINPLFAGAWNNLGIAFKDLGQPGRAISCYQRAIDIQPSFAAAHCNLGVALKLLGRYEEAVASYRQALSLVPDSVQVNTNLGNILADMGRMPEAIECYRRILGGAPDADISLKLGKALLAVGKPGDAAHSFQQVLAVAPATAPVLNYLAASYNLEGRLDEALVWYDKALSSDPAHSEAWCGLGSTLKDRGQLVEALHCFQKSIELKPDFAGAYSNILMTQHYVASITSEEMFAEALRFSGRFEAPLKETWPSVTPVHRPEQKIKVGFVSADLRNHPVGIFLEGVLKHIDRDNFSLIAYAEQVAFDSLSERIRPFFDAWVTVAAKSDAELAERIRADRVDLLIDLSGHTSGNRLPVFARRPAPVQASWLGYANTTGLKSMDFILADPVSLPPEEEQFYTEKVWRLPETYVCFTPLEIDLPVSALPVLESGAITFGCFNNPAKLNDAVITCWAGIMRAVPDSALMLKYRIFDHESERELFRQRFGACGIEPARLRFAGASPRDEYLAAYREVDFCLDPFPFPGLTTTCEALWMGVPTLTLRMARGMFGHNGELVMKTAGLGDWVAGTVEEYRELAVAFAANPAALAELRLNLRQRFLSSPLCAGERFARNLEDAFRGMVRMAAQGTDVPGCRD